MWDIFASEYLDRTTPLELVSVDFDTPDRADGRYTAAPECASAAVPPTDIEGAAAVL